eukprot:1161921-Pelagomonas_calceolata.AAC.17
MSPHPTHMQLICAHLSHTPQCPHLAAWPHVPPSSSSCIHKLYNKQARTHTYTHTFAAWPCKPPHAPPATWLCASPPEHLEPYRCTPHTFAWTQRTHTLKRGPASRLMRLQPRGCGLHPQNHQSPQEGGQGRARQLPHACPQL